MIRRWQPPPVLDLTRATRQRGVVTSLIRVKSPADYLWHEWVRLSAMELAQRGSNFEGAWRLTAYLVNPKNGAHCCDGEHDSSRVLDIELVGVRLHASWYGTTTMMGWIAGQDPDAFRVPDPGLSYLLKPGPDMPEPLKRCRYKCGMEKPHYFAHYLPPPNPELHEHLRGIEVEVTTGPAKQEEE